MAGPIRPRGTRWTYLLHTFSVPSITCRIERWTACHPAPAPGRRIRQRPLAPADDVLGEFVLPADEPPWTSALLHVAWGLGLEEKSARQAPRPELGRGRLDHRPTGPTLRVRWALTPPGHELLSPRGRRASTPSAVTRRSRDGRWLGAAGDGVPETRHKGCATSCAPASPGRLAARCPACGSARTRPGRRRPSRSPSKLGLAAETFSLHRPVRGDRGAAVAGRAGLAPERPGGQVPGVPGPLRGPAPAPGDGTLLAQIRLVDEWRRFPLADPGLPREPLPPDWIVAPGGGRVRRACTAPGRQLTRPAGRELGAAAGATQRSEADVRSSQDGWPLMPLRGGASQAAIFPGSYNRPHQRLHVGLVGRRWAASSARPASQAAASVIRLAVGVMWQPGEQRRPCG